LQLRFLVCLTILLALHLHHIARHQDATQGQAPREEDEVREAAIAIEFAALFITDVATIVLIVVASRRAACAELAQALQGQVGVVAGAAEWSSGERLPSVAIEQ